MTPTAETLALAVQVQADLDGALALCVDGERDFTSYALNRALESFWAGEGDGAATWAGLFGESLLNLPASEASALIDLLGSPLLEAAVSVAQTPFDRMVQAARAALAEPYPECGSRHATQTIRIEVGA